MGSEEASIEAITRHVQRANSIYKNTGESSLFTNSVFRLFSVRDIYIYIYVLFRLLSIHSTITVRLLVAMYNGYLEIEFGISTGALVRSDVRLRKLLHLEIV